MRDKISEPRVELLHPVIRKQVKRLVEDAEAIIAPNSAIRIVQGFRTFAEQDALYAQGRNGDTRPLVTNAKGGESYHNFALGFDFAILTDKDKNGTYEDLSWDIRKDNDSDGTADWLEVIKIFEDADWFWGGKFKSFKDYPHLQKTFDYTCKQLLAKYNKKDFIAGTVYVNL
jgi:peptidoglycan L-alanyl-D-glutamate endopeptidase CwlK